MKTAMWNPSQGLRRGIIVTKNVEQCCFMSLPSAGARNSCCLLCLACATAEKGMFSMPTVTEQAGMKVGVGCEVMAFANGKLGKGEMGAVRVE